LVHQITKYFSIFFPNFLSQILPHRFTSEQLQSATVTNIGTLGSNLEVILTTA